MAARSIAAAALSDLFSRHLLNDARGDAIWVGSDQIRTPNPDGHVIQSVIFFASVCKG